LGVPDGIGSLLWIDVQLNLRRARHGRSVARIVFKDHIRNRTLILSYFCNRADRRHDALGSLGELGCHRCGGRGRIEAYLSATAAHAPSANGRRILANPQDWHCVIFHCVCLAAYAFAFWLYHRPKLAGVTGPWSRVAFVVTSATLLGWITGIDVGVNFHNHSHRPIFVSHFVNCWFGRLWTFSGAWPSFFWEYCHVTIHHAKLLTTEDWTLPKKRPDGSFENFQRYLFMHWPWRLTAHLWRDLSARRSLRGKSLRELAIFLTLWSIPFWIDPVMALWLWALPQWIANAFIMGAGMYVQHSGCVEKTLAKPVSHSTVFVSNFFNLTMFNIGFHLEHHEHPRVHWSELPELHIHLKQEMIDGGAHVVPYGNYHAAFLLAGDDNRRKRFAEQDSGYKISR
jgi:fatty acid desaturase